MMQCSDALQPELAFPLEKPRISLALHLAILTTSFPASSLPCQGKGQQDTRAPLWSILKLSLTAAGLPGEALLVLARPRCDEH